MKILKNRFFIALVCAVIAIVCILSLNTQSSSDTITAYKAVSSINENALIDSSMIEAVTISSLNMDDAVTNVDDIVGKYASTDITDGQLILSNVLTDDTVVSNDNELNLNDNKIAYTISMSSLASTVGDSIYSGDIVTIFINCNGLSYQPESLQYVEVISAKSSSGIENSVFSTEDISTITLMVTQEQALLLNEYQYTCTIHLGLVYRGDDGYVYIEQQDAILEEIKQYDDNEVVTDFVTADDTLEETTDEN